MQDVLFILALIIFIGYQAHVENERLQEQPQQATMEQQLRK